MAPGNKIVHGLWIGTRLSNIELLTIKSFIHHGHDFYLWAYDKIETPLPEGLVLRDANEIIPREKIFTRKHLDPNANVGKGSYAGFSDIFRYKLLYEKGGWWVDMDITCLAPLDVADEYYFRAHDKLSMIGNVMKCPAGSEAMRLAYEESLVEYSENSQDWLLTNKILERNVHKQGLQKYIRAGESNNDIWPETSRFIYEDIPVPANYKFIHWMNEEWRSRGIDKNKIYSDTTLGRILAGYGFVTFKKDIVYKTIAFLNRPVTLAVHQIIKLLFAGLLLLYVLWELFWFTKSGLEVIKWHTHLMAIIFLWSGLYLLGAVVIRRISVEASGNFILLSTSVSVMLFITELFFVATGKMHTQIERYYPNYASYYTVHEPDIYHTHTGKTELVLAREEFQYPRKINSLGFSDKEWDRTKPPKQLRILALGDSFTEGDGTPYDSTYISLLQKMLLAYDSSVYVMNGGICGSDPFFNYMAYKHKLLSYQPDIVIQTLGSQDIREDIAIRGGMERFKNDSTLQFRQAPWWEPVWAISYTSRLLFYALGYNEMLVKYSDKEKQRIEADVTTLFDSYNSLVAKNRGKLVVVLLPLKYEVASNQYAYNLQPVVEKLKSSGVKVIDLLPYYRAYAVANKKQTDDYYWKIDGHHNPTGYHMMAEGILQGLLPVLKQQIIADSTLASGQ